MHDAGLKMPGSRAVNNVFEVACIHVRMQTMLDPCYIQMFLLDGCWIGHMNNNKNSKTNDESTNNEFSTSCMIIMQTHTSLQVWRQYNDEQHGILSLLRCFTSWSMHDNRTATMPMTRERQSEWQWSCAAASMHHISFTTTICTKINGANHYLRAKTKSGHFQFMKSSKIGILTSLGVNKDEAGLWDGVQWMTTRMDLPTTLWFWKRKRHPIRNLLTLCSSKILSRTLWLALCCQRPDSYNPKETTSTTWSASLCQQSISK